MTIPKPKPQPYRMQNTIRPYAWGARGASAYIPKLLGRQAEDKPCAELWMGAHPKAPSMIEMDGTNYPLDQMIEAWPELMLGHSVTEQFGPRLPFLFKVLSAAEPLSIQAHPNLEQAKTLHARDPKNYPDDNHKPEIAIALDQLTALAGFKPAKQILEILKNYPALAEFVGQRVIQKFSDALRDAESVQKERIKELYGALMRHSVKDPAALCGAIGKLKQQLQRKTRLDEAETLFLDLEQKYPDGDAGLFCIFLLNLLHLKAGEGVFLNAGIPHAYLKGNIVECMANSDNVVRAGLTPKFKDIETLVEILSYDLSPPKIIRPATERGFSEYKTPVREFKISSLQIEEGSKEILNTKNSAWMLLCIDGELQLDWDEWKMPVSKGMSVFIPASLPELVLKGLQASVSYRVEIPA